MQIWCGHRLRTLYPMVGEEEGGVPSVASSSSSLGRTGGLLCLRICAPTTISSQDLGASYVLSLPLYCSERHP